MYPMTNDACGCASCNALHFSHFSIILSHAARWSLRGGLSANDGFRVKTEIIAYPYTYAVRAHVIVKPYPTRAAIDNYAKNSYSVMTA